MTAEGVTHTLRGEWDFEASKAGPAFGHRGTTIHTLTTLMFSEDYGEGRGLGHLGPSFLRCFSTTGDVAVHDRTNTGGGVSAERSLLYEASGVLEGGAPGLEGGTI